MMNRRMELKNKTQWPRSEARTATEIVSKRNANLASAVSANLVQPEIVDIPAISPQQSPGLRSSMFTGTDVHRAITNEVRGRTELSEYASLARNLIGWLRGAGVTQMKANVALECAEVRGECDLLAYNSRYSRHGVIEVKSRNLLPDSPFEDHRLQLGLYLHAANSQVNRHNGHWGAIVYCALQSHSMRVFFWANMDVQAWNLGPAILQAA
jgi:hypothetical protein